MVKAYKDNLTNLGPTPGELSVLGIVLIVIAALLSVIPVTYLIKNRKGKLSSYGSELSRI